MNHDLLIHVDGACSGNPGEAGIGVHISADGQLVKEISRAIGHATNNIAEYSALICALEEAQRLKAKRIKIVTDSELVYRQVTGVYKVKNENMRVLFERVCQLAQSFDVCEIKHVLREFNQDADRLASSAIKKSKQAPIVAPLSPCKEEESPSSRG